MTKDELMLARKFLVTTDINVEVLGDPRDMDVNESKLAANLASYELELTRNLIAALSDEEVFNDRLSSCLKYISLDDWYDYCLEIIAQVKGVSSVSSLFEYEDLDSQSQVSCNISFGTVLSIFKERAEQ